MKIVTILQEEIRKKCRLAPRKFVARLSTDPCRISPDNAVTQPPERLVIETSLNCRSPSLPEQLLHIRLNRSDGLDDPAAMLSDDRIDRLSGDCSPPMWRRRIRIFIGRSLERPGGGFNDRQAVSSGTSRQVQPLLRSAKPA
jgi:hypothetical protein